MMAIARHLSSDYESNTLGDALPPKTIGFVL